MGGFYLQINICGSNLDPEQMKCCLCNSNKLLINAGAGSGKTFTILGKIKYLVSYQQMNTNKILCISFTKEASNSLKNKIHNYLGYEIDVFTFHKLALNIIAKYDKNIQIASNDTLDFIINEFLYHEIKRNKFIKKYLKNNSYNNLVLLIKSFINLFKGQGMGIKDFNILFKKNKSYTNHQLLKIIFIIYNLYQEELKSSGKVDFNDMISVATELIKNKYLYKDYKYIIIDEFQDTSLLRFNLIREIINKTQAKLLVVGDDFQSIYRFTGCDLNIFLDFKNYFKDSTMLSITNTYRNPQELIRVAGSFIMKNKYQIRKELKSKIHIPKPIKIIFSKNVNTLNKLLTKLIDKEVLILGRNNNDIFKYLNKEFTIDKEGIVKNSKYDNLNVKYLTMHKAKGLESEVVILINLTNNIDGIPSKIDNHKLINLISCKSNYKYDEERRLFYVALTRTKTVNYLIIDKSNISVFVKELMREYRKDIEIINI